MPLLKQRRRLAAIELNGAIVRNDRMVSLERTLWALRDNHTIRAVLLDIDSPGGSAVFSDALYRAVRRLRERKPVVAFIHGVGASGAYYVACGADRIVAAPGSIVGSIGVISVTPIVQDLLRKLGVAVEALKAGEHKDSGAFWREHTEEERAREQRIVDGFYDTFMGVVAEGRRMPKDRVRALATGDVYFPEEARAAGLVDEVGDFSRAVDVAARLGKTEPKPAWVQPRRPLLERLLFRASAGVSEAVEGRVLDVLLGGPHFLPPR